MNFINLLFFSSIATAAPSLEMSTLKSYWENEPLSIKAYFDYPDYRFLLATGSGRGSLTSSERRMQFNPANHPEVGLTLSKGIFFLHYQTALKGWSNAAYRDYDLVQTDVQDWEVGTQWKYLKLTSFYHRFKGYYVDLNATNGFTVDHGDDQTSVVIGPGKAGPADIWQRPDMATYNYGLRGELVLPVLGEDSFLFGGLQEDGAGFIGRLWEMDFTLLGGLQRLAIEGDSSFVPDSRQKYFPELVGLTGIYQNAAQFMLGMNNRIFFSPHTHFVFNGSGGGELLTQTRNQADGVKRQYATGQIVKIDLGIAYAVEKHNLFLGWSTLFRISNFEDPSLDSQFSRVSANWSMTF
ncbi:MAG: hypothetical protein KDD33_12150 [Bdellovibrionales bacterium]|nr:hypothetical protein [Bdellovibrionales bacterium]